MKKKLDPMKLCDETLLYARVSSFSSRWQGCWFEFQKLGSNAGRLTE